MNCIFFSQIWESELASRKRKVPEGGAIPDDASTPVKNMRNIPVNANQKHLNLSQIYSKFSQPATSQYSYFCFASEFLFFSIVIYNIAKNMLFQVKLQGSRNIHITK